MKKILLLLTFLTSIYSVGYAQCTPSVTITVSENPICLATVAIFTATPGNGGSAPLYEWFINNISQGGATTSSTHAFALLENGDEVIVKMTSNATCASPITAVSSAIVITVTPVAPAAITVTADKSVICQHNPVTFTATPANGGATPSMEWSINGVSQGPASSSQIFITTNILASTDVVSVHLISSLACSSPSTASANISVIVSPGIGAGTIPTNQTICYNSVPAAITQITAPTNIIGTPMYTWEASVTGISAWVTIPGAMSSTYIPTTPITQDIYLRRVITDPGTPAPCNTATSNTIHITVLPQLTADGIGSDEFLCTGSPTAPITQTVNATGGTGSYTYQWQSSFSGTSGTFTNISGATNPSYYAGSLTSTTYYQLVTTSGSCGNVTSNVVTKTIAPAEIITVSLNDPGQVCVGSIPITFTATVTTTGPITSAFNYQWFLGTTPVGTNSATYTYNPIAADNGKIIKAIVTTTGCSFGPVTSNLITLNISALTTPTISITANGNPICNGLLTTFTATSTGGGSAPTYQWYIVPSNSPVGTPGNPVGTNSTSFTGTTLTNGQQVYVELTSSSNCMIGTNPYRSSTIVMDVKPFPTPLINEGDQTICVGTSFTFTTTVGTGTTFQWFLNSILIPGATNNIYTATQSGAYSILESNSVCNSTSAPVTLTIDPCGAFSTSITGPNPITPGQQNAVYGVPNQTGFTYTWSITGGTIVSGQNTNSVTVDWDAPAANAFARTTSNSYSISVLEKNPSNQTKKTKTTINTITTSATQSQAQSGIKLFPNPTTRSFNIEMPESGTDVSYEILDLTGLSVASGTFTSTGSDQNIHADLDAGMYQIILKYNNVVTCVRLSKIQ